MTGAHQTGRQWVAPRPGGELVGSQNTRLPEDLHSSQGSGSVWSWGHEMVGFFTSTVMFDSRMGRLDMNGDGECSVNVTRLLPYRAQ